MGWHYLQPLVKDSCPREFVFFHTETREAPHPYLPRGTIHSLRLGVATSVRFDGQRFTNGEEYLFEDGNSFWAWFVAGLHKQALTVLVAHNLLFHLRQVSWADQFRNGRLVVDRPAGKKPDATKSEGDRARDALIVLGDGPKIVGLRHAATGSRFVAVDMLNWIADPLEKIGDLVSRPRLPMPGHDFCEADWVDHASNSVAIVQAGVLHFLKLVTDHNLGPLRYTAAGQSFASFRKHIKPHTLCFHDVEPVRKLERAGYFGGQTTAFWHGIVPEPVYHVDVRSMYPAIMESQCLPVKLDRYVINDYWKLAPFPFLADRSMADVLLDTRGCTYPRRRSLATMHGEGILRTVLCGRELEGAINRGHVIAYGSWAQYYIYPIFRQWCEVMRRLREQSLTSGDRVADKLVKLLSNSLYGKLAQKTSDWVDWPENESREPMTCWTEKNHDTGTRTECRQVGDIVQRKVERTHGRNTLIATAAFVTAAGREQMRTLRSIAGPAAVYYQGVDSLLVNRNGCDSLFAAEAVQESSPGSLRVVEGPVSAIIHGRCDYDINGRSVVAGRTHNAVWGLMGSYAQQMFQGGAQAFSRDPENPFVVETVIRHRAGSVPGTAQVPPGWSVSSRIDDSGESAAVLPSG